jgi:hypothetical protein
MPGDTYFRVRDISDSGSVRLLHLYRTRVGREIQGDYVNIKADQLPKGAHLGDVLHYRDGAFHATNMTLRDVALLKLEAVFGEVALKTLNRSTL